jgi:hypothetical protein
MSDHGLDEHQVNGGGDGDRMVTSRELKHRWHKSDMWLWRESQHPDSPPAVLRQRQTPLVDVMGSRCRAQIRWRRLKAE